MEEKTQEYTLWNSPMEKWTKISEGVDFTPDMKKQIQQSEQEIDKAQIDEYLEPFNTVVSEKTLSQLVG